MKHFLLKFNHGVEIGAALAYKGHFNRTQDTTVYKIYTDELKHRLTVHSVLNWYGHKPNKVIDLGFTIIGNVIGFLCKFCPIWSLNYIATIMELFAVFNYSRLARLYPQWSTTFNEMAQAELDHAEYFGIKPDKRL